MEAGLRIHGVGRIGYTEDRVASWVGQHQSSGSTKIAVKICQQLNTP